MNDAEEFKIIVKEFNERIAPVENAFMSYVRAYKPIGYGRMIQLIQEHWDTELGMKRTAYFSDGNEKGYSKDVK